MGVFNSPRTSQHLLHLKDLRHRCPDSGVIIAKDKSPPVAADEVVEDAPDKNPDEVENGSSEEGGEDLLADEGALVGLQAQDDHAPDVGAGKMSESSWR